MNVDQGTLFELILAATYLDVRGILNLLRKTTITVVKAKYRAACKPVEGYTPFEDSHYGQPNEQAREAELLAVERRFEELYNLTGNALVLLNYRFVYLDCKVQLQRNCAVIFEALLLFKKRIFHHYYRNWERFLGDPIARKEFEDVSHTTVLRVFCELADIQNTKLGVNDCWIAGEKLRVAHSDRPTIGSLRYFIKW